MPELEQPNLSTLLSKNEKADFIVKGKRKAPKKRAYYFIFLGPIGMILICIFLIISIVSVLKSADVQLKSSGLSVFTGQSKLLILIASGLFIMLFIILGLWMFCIGLYLLLAQGPWFIGTNTRLIVCSKNNTISIDWEQFNGEIEVSGSQEKGDIILKLRTGRMIHQNHRADQYVPNIVFISEVNNPYQIEKFLRQRIKENDPTPPVKNDREF